MSKQRKVVLAAMAVWILLTGVAATAAESEPSPMGESTGDLLDVRVGPGAAGLPAVTLVGRGEMAYEGFVLDAPPRLVLDLYGVVSRVDEYRFPVDGSDVIRVRAGQFTRSPEVISRVVFDLERALPYAIERSGSSLVVTFDAPAPGTDPWAGLPRDGETPAPAVVEAAPATEMEDPVAKILAVAELNRPRSEPVAGPVVESAAVEPAPEAEIEPEAGASVGPEVDSREQPGIEPDAGPADPPVVEVAGARADVSDPVESLRREDSPGREAVTEGAEPTSAVAGIDAAAEDAEADTASAKPEPREAGSRSRAVGADTLDRFLRAPAYAAEDTPGASRTGFATRTIGAEGPQYSGKRVSLNLVDADLKQVFRLFHEISGLNFVLDPSVEGRVTIVLDNVPWDQALDIILKNNGLDKVLENNVIRIAPTQKLAREAAERKALREAKELEVEPITVTRTLSYAKAKEVERVIRDGGILSDRGKVIVDERTNTLIVSDIPKKVGPLDQLISTLDTETPQVMIEARIVESSRQFVRDLGVEWGFEAIADASKGTSTGLSFPHNASVRYGLNLPSPNQASQLAFQFSNVIDSFTLDVALNALETEGRGRVLSSPKIATQNNERAEIEQGVRIPVVNTTATEIDVQFVSASLRLIVTPQITAEGTVIMDIEVENNTPDFVNRVGDVPPINTQRAATKVLIGDGGTTVIGGIFSVNEGQSETGVPWFRKLPLFGWLFKSRNVTQENRELLIFITPKIMKIG